MMTTHDDDGDSDAKCGVRAITLSFYLCNDDDDDGNRHQNKIMPS